MAIVKGARSDPASRFERLTQLKPPALPGDIYLFIPADALRAPLNSSVRAQMQLYSHIVDLRISHPALDPDVVTRTLEIEPQRSWRAGDPRKTPKGTLLTGTRSTGYWSANPFSYGWRVSTDALIEDALEELVTYLHPHREFLVGLSEAGNVQIWASTYSNRNFAVELAPSMLHRIGSLGATFIHDVYQCMQVAP